MDQEPQAPQESADDQPKIFKSINGWIAGVTGIVIALGGLAATWDRLFAPKQAEENVVAEGHPVAAADAPDEAAGSDQAPTEAANSYTTDQYGRIDYQEGGTWAETDAQGNVTEYAHQSDKDGWTTAVIEQGGEEGEDALLRWPNAGGTAQKSVDGGDHWQDAYKVTRVEEEPTG